MLRRVLSSKIKDERESQTKSQQSLMNPWQHESFASKEQSILSWGIWKVRNRRGLLVAQLPRHHLRIVYLILVELVDRLKHTRRYLTFRCPSTGLQMLAHQLLEG